MFSDGYNKDFMWTVIIVLVLAALVYLYLKYTKHGYEIAVVGDSENTARYAGIRVPRIYVRTMALSGALCGSQASSPSPLSAIRSRPQLPAAAASPRSSSHGWLR